MLYNIYVVNIGLIMHIDELHEPFARLKSSRSTLEKRIKRRIDKPIHIRDLVVRSDYQHRFGECASHRHENAYQTITESQRLLDQIACLFNLANADHRARNCEIDTEGNFILRGDKQNNITRLTTNEFSFYTNAPLSLEDFQYLYQQTIRKAHDLEPNVHVLLSSFSVKNREGQILNMSLFIEGGHPPKVHSFAKTAASTVDVKYDTHGPLFSHRQGAMDSAHAEFVQSVSGESICSGSIFEIETAGGARYTQAIDICLDHLQEHTKKQFIRQIRDEGSCTEYIPSQVEHCISSNWVQTDQRHLIANTVIQADPVVSMLDDYQAPPGSLVISSGKLNELIHTPYSEMSITAEEGRYKVSKPPFGSDFSVEVLAERAAADFVPEIKAAVEVHNRATIDRTIALHQAVSHKVEDEYVKAQQIDDTISPCLIKALDKLKRELLKKCHSYPLERLFSSEEYKEKGEARAVICDRFYFIEQQIASTGNRAILLLKTWEKDLNLKLSQIGSAGTPSRLKEDLQSHVRHGIYSDLSEELDIQFDEKEIEEEVTPTPRGKVP